MLDFSHLPKDNGADVQTFWGGTANAGQSSTNITTWQTWVKPRGVKWVYMIGVGGGASGGTGTIAATAVAGGAGGGSGAQTVVLMPAILLPPVLYIHLGAGGVTSTVVSAAAPAAGGPTYIAIEPVNSVTSNSNIFVLVANGAASATGGTATAMSGNFAFAGKAAFQANYAGQTGQSSVASNASPGNLSMPQTGLMVTAGAAGGGHGAIGAGQTAPGGTIIGIPPLGELTNTNNLYGKFGNISGGAAAITTTTASTAGQSGFIYAPWQHFGGAGGGAGGSNTTTGTLVDAGSRGGNGAPGCGGGGSGAGATIGALPGSGGDGFVHIISF